MIRKKEVLSVFYINICENQNPINLCLWKRWHDLENIKGLQEKTDLSWSRWWKTRKSASKVQPRNWIWALLRQGWSSDHLKSRVKYLRAVTWGNKGWFGKRIKRKTIRKRPNHNQLTNARSNKTFKFRICIIQWCQFFATTATDSSFTVYSIFHYSCSNLQICKEKTWWIKIWSKDLSHSISGEISEKL